MKISVDFRTDVWEPIGNFYCLFSFLDEFWFQRKQFKHNSILCLIRVIMWFIYNLNIHRWGRGGRRLFVLMTSPKGAGEILTKVSRHELGIALRSYR